ncbi:extracellular solute-binding protein [Paenibacillus sp. GCM10027628]|uniref:ABC transporter substrate-binding protein n=1 Tax=Paenibacillus sp. GCM10027628 TaxID=3273413 RepID=UPI003637EE0C
MRGLSLKKALISSTVVSMMMIVSACGSTKTAAPTASESVKPADATAAAAATAKPPERVKLKILGHVSWFKSGYEAVKKDAALHGFDLEEEKVPDTDAGNDLIKTRFATKDTPDLLLFFPGSIFSNFGPPADNFVKQEDQSWMANFDKAKWVRALDEKESAASDVRGYYAAPYWGANVSAVLYNKKVFESLNLKVPKTTAEFLAVCEALKQAGKTPVFYAGKDNWTLQLLPFDSASKQGYNELANKINKNTAKFTQYDNLKKGILSLVDLKNKGYINKDFLSDTYDNAEKALATGTAGMFHMGTWMMSDIATKFPDNLNDIGSFIMPFDGNDSDILPVFAPYGFFVPKGKNQEAAQRFVNYFESIETQNLYFANEGGIPAIKGVTKTKLSSAEMDAKSLLDANRGYPNWQYGFDYSVSNFGVYLQDALVGSKTADQVLEAMDKDFEKDAKVKKDPNFK